jgi:DNA repair exonuclease SbcCD nuclease subunit
MNFCHTADLHLKKEEEKRTEILKLLIEEAKKLEANYFIIAGDLFDSDTDATILRPKLKDIFNNVNMKFLVIPGNHDLNSFSKDYDYGQNVIQLINKPFEIIEIDGLKICGVPYQKKKFVECIKNIPSDIDILICHGTLYDESFIFSLLDDEETQYMPIYPANLEDIARYVAMGHLHSRSIETDYKTTKVVYPGSPIALDTKCTSERKFYFLDINKKKLQTKPIKLEFSPFWTEKEFCLFPGIESEILEEIESYLDHTDNQNSLPYVVLKGFIGESDKDFNTKVDSINQKFKEKFSNLKIHNEVHSWDRIYENHLVKNFVARTKNLDNTLRMKIFEITFPIFSDILK